MKIHEPISLAEPIITWRRKEIESAIILIRSG